MAIQGYNEAERDFFIFNAKADVLKTALRLHYASCEAHKKVVTALLAAGAGAAVNVTDKNAVCLFVGIVCV